MTILFFCLAAAALAGAAILCVAAYRRDGKSAVVTAILSAAGGLVLDWFIQTAAERRVFRPDELFLLFRDGAPRAGKLAVLAACVLAALLFGLTSAGKRLRGRFRALSANRGAPWLYAAAITGLFVLWTTRITVIHFMTSDENTLLVQIGAVAENGLSAAAGSYSNVLFCGLIALMYRLWPGGYWYAWYHLAVLSVSLTVIGRCILLRMRSRSIALGSVLHLFVCGLFMYAFSELSFTVTPAAAGAAACALVMCRQDTPGLAGCIASDIGSAVLMLLCCLQRRSTFQALVCFFALACAYALAALLRSRDSWKRAIPLILSVCVLLGLASGARRISDAVAATVDPAARHADSVRSNVVDFHIDEMTQEQFDEAGIPQELAVLLRGWYFMDERITTQSLEKLLELNRAQSPGSARERVLSDPAAYAASLVRQAATDPHAWLRMACVLSLLLMTPLAPVFGGRRAWLEALCALLAAGGSALMLIYLTAGGRLPTRVYLVVLLPAAVIMLLSVLYPARDGGSEAPAPRWARACWLGLTAAFCVLCAACVYVVPYAAEYADADAVYADQRAFEGYAEAHPELLFITNIYDDYPDPFHAPAYPDNLVRWGDVGSFRQDRERLYSDAFFRDDVRFMCKNPGYILFMMQYLSLDYGPVEAEGESQLTRDTMVYRLERLVPDGHYTGWLEKNGMTYYFEDGQAAVGSRTLEGETYEFMPAGAASAMVIVPGEDRTVYTTNAYSLAAAEP